ncbi:hypothetical protein D3C85_1877750 [compost metagenome]
MFKAGGVARNFQILISAAAGLEHFGAVIGGFVEGFVELAAAVINKSRVSEGRTSHHRAESNAACDGLGKGREFH